MKNRSFAAAAIALASLSVQAAGVVETALAADNFKTLVAALKAAELVDMLNGKGPLIVFPPNDEAFAKISKADLDKFLASNAKFKAVLTQRVISGTAISTHTKLGDINFVQAAQLTIATTGGMKVDNAKVVAPDVAADNDVLYAIVTVLRDKFRWTGCLAHIPVPEPTI